MSVLVDKNTLLIVQGFRAAKALPRPPGGEIRNQVVGGVTPGKAEPSTEGIDVFNTVAEAREEPAPTPPSFSSAALCSGRDHGSRRCRESNWSLHHRRHSNFRHDSRQCIS